MQDGLISAVAALGKPMVVVLEGGSVINDAVAGERAGGGHGLVPGAEGRRARSGKLLFGKANNWGKLPLSWPATEARTARVRQLQRHDA